MPEQLPTASMLGRFIVRKFTGARRRASEQQLPLSATFCGKRRLRRQKTRRPLKLEFERWWSRACARSCSRALRVQRPRESRMRAERSREFSRSCLQFWSKTGARMGFRKTALAGMGSASGALTFAGAVLRQVRAEGGESSSLAMRAWARLCGLSRVSFRGSAP